MAGWFYMRGEDQVGPIDDRELKARVDRRELNLATMLLHPVHTKNKWVCLERIPALAARASKGEQPTDATIIEPEPVDIPSSGRRMSPWMVLAVIFLGGPLVLCSGCLTIGLIGNALGLAPEESSSNVAPIAAAPPAIEEAPPVKKKQVEIYAAVEDFVCATDSDFLDSSALASPANFARVEAGTEVVIRHVWGVFSGKLYYELSAGGSDSIYIYKNDFERRFKKIATIEQ